MNFGRQNLFRRAGALALALWLGGVGCLLCCERPARAAGDGAAPHHVAPGGEGAVAQAPAPCPLHAAKTAARAAQAEAARRGRDESSASRAGEPSPVRGAPRCCRDKGQPVVMPFKPRAPSDAAAVSTSGALPSPRAAAHVAPAPAPRSRLPDGGETYLRCCILLI